MVAGLPTSISEMYKGTPHFSVWSALIHLILIWTPFQSPNFWSGVPDPCPQVTGQFWGIVHLEPLGVYAPSNFEENLLQDLGGDLLSCLSSGYSHVVYSSKCSPDPLLVMGWNQDLVSSLGSVNIPCIEILNKCLLWGIRITNFSILVWFWTFFFDWAKFGGHTPAPTPSPPWFAPMTWPLASAGNLEDTLGQLNQAILLQTFPILIAKCLGSKWPQVTNNV